MVTSQYPDGDLAWACMWSIEDNDVTLQAIDSAKFDKNTAADSGHTVTRVDGVGIRAYIVGQDQAGHMPDLDFTTATGCYALTVHNHHPRPIFPDPEPAHVILDETNAEKKLAQIVAPRLQ